MRMSSTIFKPLSFLAVMITVIQPGNEPLSQRRFLNRLNTVSPIWSHASFNTHPSDSAGEQLDQINQIWSLRRIRSISIRLRMIGKILSSITVIIQLIAYLHQRITMKQMFSPVIKEILAWKQKKIMTLWMRVWPESNDCFFMRAARNALVLKQRFAGYNDHILSTGRAIIAPCQRCGAKRHSQHRSPLT